MKTAQRVAARPENYRELLLAKKSELSSSVRANLGNLAGPANAAVDDLAPVSHDQFIALGINRLDSIQLAAIETALKRIDSEEYGLCMDCGNAISRGRLEAIPWASRCVACQEFFASSGDPRR